jgi:tetratricopeptide (TPR) repeat protein
MGERAPVPLLLALCLLAVSATGAEPAVGVARGWQQLAQSKTPEARAAFAAVPPADPAAREARLGEAVALFSLQPRTDAKIAEAARLLETLRAADPNDPSGLAAAYYLARIAHIHGTTPDHAAAIAGYRALLAAHPENFHAQLAAPKLALLLLYDDVPPAEWDRRVAEVTALLPRLTAPEAVRDTRLTLAMALIRLRHDAARAYPLFAACLDNGAVTRMPRLNALLVLAAESAQQLGKTSDAAAHYARFLAEFPHDAKSDEIRRRLDRLQPQERP